MKAPSRRPSKSNKEEVSVAKESINLIEKNEKSDVAESASETEVLKIQYEGPPYILHEIECLCLSRVQSAMAHDGHGRRFDVFSLIDKEGEIIPSVVQCEDCGRKWEINGLDNYDLAQIDRMPTYTRKRLQRVLPSDLVHLCEEWKVSTAVIAHIQWIMEEKQWGTHILLSKKKYRREDTSFDTRILVINGPINFKINEIKASDVAEFW